MQFWLQLTCWPSLFFILEELLFLTVSVYWRPLSNYIPLSLLSVAISTDCWAGTQQNYNLCWLLADIGLTGEDKADHIAKHTRPMTGYYALVTFHLFKPCYFVIGNIPVHRWRHASIHQQFIKNTVIRWPSPGLTQRPRLFLLDSALVTPRCDDCNTQFIVT